MLDTSNKWSYIYSVSTTALGWLALGLSIASIAVNNWINNGGIWYGGLLFLCNDTVCVSTDKLSGIFTSSWYHSVLGLMICCSMSMFLACLFNVVAQLKSDGEGKLISAFLFLAAAFFGMTGGSTFAGGVGRDYPPVFQGVLYYGYGFVFAWLASVLALTAFLFNYRLYGNIPTRRS